LLICTLIRLAEIREFNSIGFHFLFLHCLAHP
jgi:hypothetical protein